MSRARTTAEKNPPRITLCVSPPVSDMHPIFAAETSSRRAISLTRTLQDLTQPKSGRCKGSRRQDNVRRHTEVELRPSTPALPSDRGVRLSVKFPPQVRRALTDRRLISGPHERIRWTYGSGQCRQSR